MFKFEAPKDEKAQHRIGATVKYDWYPAMKFKVVSRSWDANGALFYTIDSLPKRVERYTGVRAKALSKV